MVTTDYQEKRDVVRAAVRPSLGIRLTVIALASVLLWAIILFAAAQVF